MDIYRKIEEIDVSDNKLLNDFLYAVCYKLGLDLDGDMLNTKAGTFAVYANKGIIVKTEKNADYWESVHKFFEKEGKDANH